MYMYRQSPNANTQIFLFILQEKSCSKWGEWFDSIPHFFVQKMHRLLSPLSIPFFFSISLVIENSRSAVSGEQPKLETNSFSSVLSGFVMQSRAFLSVTLIGKILRYAIILSPSLSILAFLLGKHKTKSVYFFFSLPQADSPFLGSSKQ